MTPEDNVTSIDASPEFNLNAALYSLNDSDIVPLPSGVEATIREMTGNDQRNFMNRAKQMNGTAIQDLLAACVETVDGEVIPTDPADRTKYLLNMLSGDRQTLVFQIRRHSLGNDFSFRAKCPNPECKKDASWEVDLSIKDDFPMIPYKLGSARFVEYDSKVAPGLKIQLKMMDGNDEMTLFRKRQTITVLSDLELRSPKAFDPATKKYVPITLSKVPDRLITEMRRTLREYEGSLRTTVDLICEDCNTKVTFNLLEQPDFMTPSATF
jgi:hypothetical protein